MITIQVSSLAELKGFCKEYLELAFHAKNIVSETGRIRERKSFEDFEIEQIIGWMKQGKKNRWMAIQLSRTSTSISQIVYKLRKDSRVPQSNRVKNKYGIS